MALDVSEFVRVTTRIAAGGVPRQAFGRGLLITEDDGLAPTGSGKVRLFNDLADVETALGTGDAYDAAAVWFAGEPAPQGLYIGRWQPTDIDTVLRGGTIPSSQAFNAAPLNAANGSFVLNGVNVTGVNLSSANDGAAIATALQAAIRAAGAGTPFSGWTVAYDSAGRRFTISSDSASPIEGGGLANTDPTVGTDIAEALELDAASATYLPGTTAETITAGAAAMLDLTASGRPTSIMLAGDVRLTYGGGSDDTRLDLAAWAETQDLIFYLRETDDQALEPEDAATASPSHAYRAFAANYGHTACVYAAAGQYPDVGLAALLSSQDFSLPASIISPHRKTIPGVVGVDLADSQWEQLKAKRCNAVAVVGASAYLVGGWTSRPAYWADAVHFLLWLESEIESAIWAAMGNSRRFGAGLLADTLNQVLQTAVEAGGLERGGKVTDATAADIRATLGLRDFDGILSAGFLVWVDMRPSAADRENRIGRFKVYVVGSGAIHEVIGNVVFTN